MLADAGVPGVAGADDPSLQFDGPVIDDVPAEDAPAEDDWREGHRGSRDLNADDSGFDIFDEYRHDDRMRGPKVAAHFSYALTCGNATMAYACCPSPAPSHPLIP